MMASGVISAMVISKVAHVNIVVGIDSVQIGLHARLTAAQVFYYIIMAVVGISKDSKDTFTSFAQWIFS